MRRTVRKIVVNRRPIGPGQAVVLALVEKNGKFETWMVNVFPRLGYSNSESYGAMVKRMVRAGYLDNEGRITDKGKMILEGVKRRGGQYFERFVREVVKDLNKKADENVWQYWDMVIEGKV